LRGQEKVLDRLRETCYTKPVKIKQVGGREYTASLPPRGE